MVPVKQKIQKSKKNNKFPDGVLTEAKLAFFDLDETITDTDTDGLWARWRLMKARGGLREVISIFSLMRSYRRGTMSIERYVNYHRKRVSALTREKYDEMTKRFFSQWGRRHIFREAEAVLNHYRERSVPVILITAQNDVIAKRFSDFLEMEDVAANAFNYEEGKFTSPVTPYCYREGKIEYARMFAEKYSVSLEECAFYSDSINDLPLLEQVGYPVATNPDTLLHKEASRRMWPIVFFKK